MNKVESIIKRSLLFSLLLLSLLPNLAFSQGVGVAFWKKKGGTQPTSLSLNHVRNSKSFTVSWTSGSGNGGPSGCKLQYLKDSTTWTDLAGTFNCDANTASAAASLPSTDNWTNNFNSTGVNIRLVRVVDLVALGTFTQKLGCSSKSGSISPTPDTDENCNAVWDDVVSTTSGYRSSIVTKTANFGEIVECESPFDLGFSELQLVQIDSHPISYTIYADDSCTTPSVGTDGNTRGTTTYVPIIARNNLRARFTQTLQAVDHWGYYGFVIDITSPLCQSNNETALIQYYQRHRSLSEPDDGLGSIKMNSIPTGSIKYICDYIAPNTVSTYQ